MTVAILSCVRGMLYGNLPPYVVLLYGPSILPLVASGTSAWASVHPSVGAVCSHLSFCEEVYAISCVNKLFVPSALPLGLMLISLVTLLRRACSRYTLWLIMIYDISLDKTVSDPPFY